MKNSTLPPQFVALEPFAAGWALATEKERHDRLMLRSIAELRVFYDAMLPRMDEITIYLNQFPLDAMPADAQALFDMGTTFMESAHPIDLRWKTTDIEDKFPAERFLFLPPSCA